MKKRKGIQKIKGRKFDEKSNLTAWTKSVESRLNKLSTAVNKLIDQDRKYNW